MINIATISAINEYYLTSQVYCIPHIFYVISKVLYIIGQLTHYLKGDMESFGEKEHKTIAMQGMEVSSENKVEHHAEKEIKNNSNEKSKNY